MRVRGVMRRRYGLRVRRRAVVEVHLGPRLVVGLGHEFLGLFDAFRPGAYHPHKQGDDYEEYDRGGYTAGDVRKVGLVLAVRPDKGTDASARRLASQVLDARTFVLAEVLAHVLAHSTGAVETGPAFALEVRRLRYQPTIGVYVAVLARHVRFARIPTLGFTGLRDTGNMISVPFTLPPSRVVDRQGGKYSNECKKKKCSTYRCYGLGAHVRRARQTDGLLNSRLVRSLLTGNATVLGRVQICT